MQGQYSSQGSFFGMIYEEVIPGDHLLLKLAAAVDFSFVSALVGDCYCPDNGRPWWDPLVLFKVVFLPFGMLRVVSFVEPQFLYDLSDREVAAQINLHLACKSPTRHSALATARGLAAPPPDTPPAELRDSPDPDARFGRKSAQKSFYGYPSTCSGW